MTSEPDNSVQTTAVGNKSFWKRRGIVTTSVVLSMLGGCIILAPTVITATTLRNRLLNAAIGNDELTATAESSTGGWFAPLMFRDVRIANSDGQFLWTINRIQLSKGLLPLITAPADIGEIRLTDSSLKVHLNADGQWPLKARSKSSKSELSFHVENGSLELSVPWRDIPIVELKQLTVTGNIGPNADGRQMLNVDPVQMLNHAPLSELHTRQNLALIAPVLSQSTTLSGSASVWLDQIHVPLDDDVATAIPAGTASETVGNDKDDFSIHGRAVIHQLDARLKQDWTQQITALIGQVSGTTLPNQIQVIKDSTVGFSVSKEGISHDGMVFLLPQIAQELTFTSSGILRLDETLDLLLTLKVPKVVPAGRPFLALLARFTEAPIQVRIAGTVSEPKLQLPAGVNPLSSLAGPVSPAQYSEEAPPLPTAVMDLIQGVGSPDREQVKKDLPGNILNLIRAVDEQTRQQRAERKSRRK